MADPNGERIGKIPRKHVRISVQLNVRFVLEGGKTGCIYEALTNNISRGGVCLVVHDGKANLIAEINRRMPRLKVSLYLKENEHPLDIQTRTRWISSKVGWFMTPASEEMPVLVGMAFEDLTPEDAETIDMFIEELVIRNREPIMDLEERLLSTLRKKS